MAVRESRQSHCLVNYVIRGNERRDIRLPGCDLCHRTALLLREFLLSPTTPVHPADVDSGALLLLKTHNSWVVRGADGGVHLKWRAVAYVFEQNPLLAWFGWLTDLPPLRASMARVYDCIGAHRRALAPLARRLLAFRSERPIGTAMEMACGVLMWLALICNVLSLPWPGKERISPAVIGKPAGRSQVFEALQIGQSWSLFAPVPTHYQRRYALTGVTADGTRIDLTQDVRQPLLWNDGYRVRFASHRWLNYFVKLDTLTKEQEAALGSYLCRWARRPRQGLPAPIRTVEIVASIRSVDDSRTEAARPPLQQSHSCEP